MTDQDTYLATDAYFHAIDRIEQIVRTFDPADPDDLRTKIIEALGDLGVWPASVFSGNDEEKAAA